MCKKNIIFYLFLHVTIIKPDRVFDLFFTVAAARPSHLFLPAARGESPVCLQTTNCSKEGGHQMICRFTCCVVYMLRTGIGTRKSLVLTVKSSFKDPKLLYMYLKILLGKSKSWGSKITCIRGRVIQGLLYVTADFWGRHVLDLRLGVLSARIDVCNCVDLHKLRSIWVRTKQQQRLIHPKHPVPLTRNPG